MSFALSKNLLAGYLVSLHHLDGKDVIDLNVMSRDAIVQKVGREHHVVALVPELGVILVVKGKDITSADEAETRNNKGGEPEPQEQARVIKRTVRGTDDQAREDWSHDTKRVIDLNPEKVNDLECAEEGVLRVLAFTHLEITSNFTNEAASLSEALVVDVLNYLEATGLQEP